MATGVIEGGGGARRGRVRQKRWPSAATKANDDAAAARAALTQSLQAAQTKALEEQADSLQEAHGARLQARGGARRSAGRAEA